MIPAVVVFVYLGAVLAIAVLQTVVPPPPAGAAVSILSVAGIDVIARTHLINAAQHRGRRDARLARRDDREYRQYARKEQRRQAGCIAGRMPAHL